MVGNGVGTGVNGNVEISAGKVEVGKVEGR